MEDLSILFLSLGLAHYFFFLFFWGCRCCLITNVETLVAFKGARLVTFDNNILSSIIRYFRWRRNERGRGEKRERHDMGASGPRPKQSGQLKI